MKHSGLGRGLDVLLPDSSPLLETVVRDLSVDEIDPNSAQPRRHFEEKALNELAESIRNVGVLSPILVVENGSRYRIVAGERRFRAARLAGLATVPCIVRDYTDEQQMAAALIENIQRQDLNPIEEASAIRSLMDEFGYKQEEASKKLGKSRPALANSLRMLKLPESIIEYVRSGALSSGHARVLCGIEDSARQLSLAEKCVQEDWSVRRLEEEGRQKPSSRKKLVRELSPEMTDLQERFRKAFGSKTVLSGSEKKGKITLSYSSADELEQIYETVSRLL